MKKIVDIKTKEEIIFAEKDLPMLVHGKEHSGASLLSITIASLLHSQGNKLCIFTAYDMAGEEFMKQVKNSETVYCLENEQNIFEALKFQTIIVQSGNIELFIKLVSDQSAMKDRVIFIKNVETIKAQISRLLDPYMFVVSGDFELNVAQQDLKNKAYRTKIFLTPISGELIPRLEKYQGFMKSKQGDKIIAVN